MIHDDPLRTEIHAALDEISQPPPDLAPASMARIRRTPAPHRQLMPALRAAGVLALAAIVGGIVFASHQASGNRRPATNSRPDRKSTRLNSSHSQISYAVFCLKKKHT